MIYLHRKFIGALEITSKAIFQFFSNVNSNRFFIYSLLK